MSARDIPSDATIPDVLDRLKNADEYVRRVVQTMSHERNVHGAIVVRIGVKGTGAMPNYRIDQAVEPWKPIAAYDGQSHKLFTDVRNIDTENWSTASMTFEEVQAVLGSIRGFRR